MKVYVLIIYGYANLEYYDVCSDVIGVFSSKEKAIDGLYLSVNDFDHYNVLYNEKSDIYELQDKNTKEIDEHSSWYRIEEHELN